MHLRLQAREPFLTRSRLRWRTSLLKPSFTQSRAVSRGRLRTHEPVAHQVDGDERQHRAEKELGHERVDREWKGTQKKLGADDDHTACARVRARAEGEQSLSARMFTRARVRAAEYRRVQEDRGESGRVREDVGGCRRVREGVRCARKCEKV